MIKVLIADDHDIFREGLKKIIEDTPDIKVTGEASDGFEAIKLIRKNIYDVIILDISMPGKSGLEVISQIKTIDKKIPVLVLSMYSEDQYALRILKIGASGYLTKECACNDIICAIRKIAGGRKYISMNIAEKLADDVLEDFHSYLHEKLSNREFQVLQMIASGKTISEIADELSLSVKTISTNRTRILDKMHLHNNAQIISYALKQGLVL